MSGTKAGGIKARDKNIETYGKDFYKEIGAMGGKVSGKGGFWYTKYVRGDVEAVREAGAKGGRKSSMSPEVRAEVLRKARAARQKKNKKHWWSK